MKVTSAYIATPADLPEELVKGRKYFVESTGQIIVDFGNGPVEFGNTQHAAKATII